VIVHTSALENEVAAEDADEPPNDPSCIATTVLDLPCDDLGPALSEDLDVPCG
jgi:hypothetical protein